MEGGPTTVWKCTACGFVHLKEKSTDCPQCGHPTATLFSVEQKNPTPLAAKTVFTQHLLSEKH